MDQQYSSQPLLDLEIDPMVSRALREATRWAKFIAIIETIFLAILFIIVAIGGSRITEGLSSVFEDSPFAEIIGSAFLLIVGVCIAVAGVLLFFLFKFSSQLKDALENHDQPLFNSGLKSLRNYFILYGVVAIVYFALVIVGVIVGLTLVNSI